MPKNLRVITIEEVTEKYGFHPNTITSWLKQGLRHYREGRGRKVYIFVSDLQGYLDEHYAKKRPMRRTNPIIAKRLKHNLRVRARNTDRPRIAKE